MLRNDLGPWQCSWRVGVDALKSAEALYVFRTNPLWLTIDTAERADPSNRLHVQGRGAEQDSTCVPLCCAPRLRMNGNTSPHMLAAA